MIYREIIIKNEDGLKAKAAANFVQEANQYDSQILIEFSNKKINAKSIMGLLSLGVKKGDPIYVYKKDDKPKTKKDMEEIRKAWEEKRQGRTMVGKEMKLSDFLNKKL